jgi:hypothetical protein
MPSASGRALVAATFVVALAGTSQVGGAGSDRHPAGLRTPALLRAGAGPAPSRVVTELPGWHGGAFRTATGDTATIYVSDTYPEDQVLPQTWAEFFAALPHGRELASVLVRIAPLAEVELICGAGALGCYRGGELVVTGEAAGGTTPEEVARHEYGHHVASNRSNPPWRAVDWGPKRWASVQRICSRTETGTAFPGDEADRYRLNPGEAFAETFRVLAERKAGAALSSWSIVDGSFYPGADALRAAEEDVTKPWTTPEKKTVRARFRADGPRRWLLPVTAPLDGELTAELRLPPGRLDTLELLTAEGRVLARGLWAATSTRRLSFVICGQRRIALRVTRSGTPGRFDLTVTRP